MAEILNLERQIEELRPHIYRKEIIISGSPVGPQYNYPIQVNVHHSDGIDSAPNIFCNTNCRPDFNDIRFTTADGITELDYWIEATHQSVATIWVEVNLIPISGTSIYIYYGNLDATSTSDGDDTWLIFDDFEDDIIDVSLWNQTKTGGSTITEESGYLKMKSTGYAHYAYVTSKQAYDFPDGTRIRFRTDIKSLTTTSGCFTLSARKVDRSGDNVLVEGRWYRWENIDRYLGGVDSFQWHGDNRHAYLGFSTHEMIHANDDFFNWTVSEGTYTWSDSKYSENNFPDTSDDRYVRFATGHYINNEVWWDWVLVGKCVDPEPYITEIGSATRYPEGELLYSNAHEHFLDYKEVDTEEVMSVIDERVKVVSMERDDDVYLSKDFGEGYFGGDFTIYYQLNIQEVEAGDSSDSSHGWAISLSKSDGTYTGDNNQEDIFGVYLVQSGSSDNEIKIRFMQRASDVLVGDDITSVDMGSYYLEMSRVGTNATLKMYDDPQRLELLDVLTFTCNLDKYRYLLPIQGLDDNTNDPNDWASYEIKNLELYYIESDN